MNDSFSVGGGGVIVLSLGWGGKGIGHPFDRQRGSLPRRKKKVLNPLLV